MAGAVIRTEGLRELRARMREVDRRLPRQLRLAGNRAAAVVVREAVPLVPRRTGRTAGSIRAASTQSGARVRGGGARVSWFPWLEFGGRVGRNNSVHRDRVKAGRYLYPTIARHKGEIVEEFAEGVRDAVRDTGLRIS